MNQHCRHGHSLADAYQTKTGRACRTCRLAASRKFKQTRESTKKGVPRPSRQKPKDGVETRINALCATIERTKAARRVDGELLKAYRLGLLSLMRVRG